MKMQKKYLLIVSMLVGISCLKIFGQTLVWKNISADEAVKVYTDLNKLYSNTSSYSVHVTYASYENYTTGTIYEASTGYFNKYGNNYHSFLLGIHTIQNTNYKIVVDSSRRTIAVVNPDKAFENGFTMIDYKEILKNCSSIKMANDGNDNHYRIEFKNTNNINAYEYTISSAGWIKELTLFYNKNYTDEDGKEKNIKPRLQMTFTDYKENITEGKNELDESKYFTKQGYKIILIGNYKDYHLSDQRVIPN
jgi:hypothetical protein